MSHSNECIERLEVEVRESRESIQELMKMMQKLCKCMQMTEKAQLKSEVALHSPQTTQKNVFFAFDCYV